MKRSVLCLLLLSGIANAAGLDDNPIDKVVRWGGSVAVVAMAIDAFSPNWEIQEARFPGNHYQLFLQMKRTYSGGAGEARVVFQRRAKELMRAGSFDGYEVLEYSEGLESSVLGSQRNAIGVIKLTRSR